MRLLTMKQVTEKVGFSRTQINRYRHDPAYTHVAFPRATVIGGKVLWLEREIDDWIIWWLGKR